MSNTKIVRLERTEFTLDNEGKKEYEKAMLLSIYQSLFNAGKISFEQLKYLENMKKVSNMSTHVREDVELTTESDTLILSTCVGGNENARYIVQAVKVCDGREYAEEE